MPPPPHPATKRPFESDTSDIDQSKRIKTEIDPPQQNGFQEDPNAEDSLEDGLALLVQNALSNVGDLVSQFSQEPDISHTATAESMDIDSATIPEASLPPAPVTFASDPQRFMRNATRHALGNMVGLRVAFKVRHSP